MFSKSMLAVEEFRTAYRVYSVAVAYPLNLCSASVGF